MDGNYRKIWLIYVYDEQEQITKGHLTFVGVIELNESNGHIHFKKLFKIGKRIKETIS